MPIRVGVIGAGFAGAAHARSLRGLDDATIIAGRPVPIDGDAGLRALEVAIAAYRPVDERRPIQIAELRP